MNFITIMVNSLKNFKLCAGFSMLQNLNVVKMVISKKYLNILKKYFLNNN